MCFIPHFGEHATRERILGSGDLVERLGFHAVDLTFIEPLELIAAEVLPPLRAARA